MITKRYYRCFHCNALAREYFGLEGGCYVGAGVNFECSKSPLPNKAHEFRYSDEAVDEKEVPPMHVYTDFFGGVGATVDVEHYPGDMFNHDFRGTITGINGNFITVKDQDDNEWDCLPRQLTDTLRENEGDNE